MIDTNEIAALLHIVEKVRDLPHLKNIGDHAMVHLKEINEEHGPVNRPAPRTEDEQRFTPQPRIPDPDPRTDLSKMNHADEERIEDRFEKEPEVEMPNIDRRV